MQLLLREKELLFFNPDYAIDFVVRVLRGC